MNKTKTCGECKYHDKYSCLQLKDNVYISPTHLACIRFFPKNPTNGDMIWRGGNRELAECCVYEIGDMFASTLIADKTFDTYEDAVDAVESWLDSPVEGECR